MAHQWLIFSFGSSSLVEHFLFWLIFFWLFFALPKSPRVILRALCGFCLVLCVTVRVRMLFCAVYPTAGAFLPDITVPPASSLDSAPADGGKARNKAAALWQRVRQSARADISQRLQRHVDLLREKLAAVQQELVNEKDRRNAISAPSRNRCSGRNNFLKRRERLARRG
jgi:hypothetical protein